MKKDVSRKQYEPEFKQNAVKLAENIGVVSTAEKLNIPLSTLQRDTKIIKKISSYF